MVVLVIVFVTVVFLVTVVTVDPFSSSTSSVVSTITEVKGDEAHEIYKWAKKNYGKSAIPKWNFYKILINKEGIIEDTFASFTKPMSNKLIKKIEEIL